MNIPIINVIKNIEINSQPSLIFLLFIYRTKILIKKLLIFSNICIKGWSFPMLKKTQKKKTKLHLAKQLELRLIKFIPSIHSFVCLYHKLRIKQTVIPDKSSNY